MKNQRIDVEEFVRNFRLYFKSLTEIEITDKPFNISAIIKITDKENQLEVNLIEIQNFFDKYVDIEDFKIKNISITNLEKK